jgi:hypothetical protein
MEGMFTDVKVSEDIMAAYREQARARVRRPPPPALNHTDKEREREMEAAWPRTYAQVRRRRRARVHQPLTYIGAGVAIGARGGQRGWQWWWRQRRAECDGADAHALAACIDHRALYPARDHDHGL